MPSRNKILIAIGLALAGCGHGGRYDDARTIVLPRGAALAPDVPRDDPAPRRMQQAPASYDPPPSVAAGADLPPEVAQSQGPRGTSGEAHADTIGYAVSMTAPPEARWSSVAIGVAHPTLEPGTLVEVTALDTGRTIVAMVVSRDAGDGVVALSPGAAQALGVGERAGVRVRTIAASPQDRIALQSGQAAAARLDAPPALLAALRRRLPAVQQRLPARALAPVRRAAAPRPDRPAIRGSAPATARSGGYLVQVAALSSGARAAALANNLGGHVARSGGLFRVQIGPFPDAASAQRARDGAARRGYGDAKIFHIE